LRSDRRAYPVSFERYLQLPASLDPRIGARANAMIANPHAQNRYDEAKAIESELKADYGYNLEMKASGPDPLSDFLFNVKSGHCEYFSTAMAVMLRTRGIAARVVNGFLPGEYNEAAGAYTVRQGDAHSWVEVYFPETQSWITFDPTPAAGRTEPVRAGLAGQLGKYAEALELMWLEYVVGYDKQQQRSLATALRNQLFDYRRALSRIVSAVRNTILSHAGAVLLIGFGVISILLLVRIGSRVRRLGWRQGLSLSEAQAKAETSTVLFYERLMRLLARRGVQRDPSLTPLEFASRLDFEPALAITRAYNRVRYGGQKLSANELREIESSLTHLEATIGEGSLSHGG
jgi:hypothetical protein